MQKEKKKKLSSYTRRKKSECRYPETPLNNRKDGVPPTPENIEKFNRRLRITPPQLRDTNPLHTQWQRHIEHGLQEVL